MQARQLGLPIREHNILAWRARWRSDQPAPTVLECFRALFRRSDRSSSPESAAVTVRPVGELLPMVSV